MGGRYVETDVGSEWVEDPVVAPAPDFASLSADDREALAGQSSSQPDNSKQQYAETRQSAIKKLTDNIMAQGTMDKWSTGSGLSKEQAAYLMAEKMHDQGGVTDLKQFGKIPVMQTVPITERFTMTLRDDDGNPVTANAPQIKRDAQGNLVRYVSDGGGGEYDSGYYAPLSTREAAQITAKTGYLTDDGEGGNYFKEITPAQQTQVKDGKLTFDTGQMGYGNKTTGQVIPVTYDRAKPNDWGGTFAGDSSSGFGVQFDAQGNPYFYTQYDTVDPFGGLGPILGIAASYFGGPLGAAAFQAANTIARGGDFGDVLESGAKGYLGGQLGGELASGLTGTLGSTMANIVGDVAKQSVVSGGKIDPVQALLSGGFSAGTNAVLGEIPGFADMSKSAQASLTNLVANTLKTGDLDPAKAVNAAINAGMSFANQSGPSSSDMIEGYFAPGGEGYIAPTDIAPVTMDGMTPGEVSEIDWASLYAEPTTNPVTGETIVGGDLSQYPVQDFGESAKDALETGTINVGPGGFTSGWQTSGADRIMLQDDGTGIGVNENGESYALTPEQVTAMISNGQLNTQESGYVAATGGTGNLPGGSGAAAKEAQQKAAASAKAASDKAAADKAAADKAAADKAARDKAANDAFNQLKAQQAAQQAQQNALMQMMSGNPELANIKSNTNLFGAIPGMEPPASSAQQQDTPDTSWDQQFATGGHVDDFSVDALLHILRS